MPIHLIPSILYSEGCSNPPLHNANLEISPVRTTRPEIERRQPIAVITKTSTNTAIVPSQETDITEIAQFHANPTSVTTVILVLDRPSHNTIVLETTLIQIANHRHHINPTAINLDPHPFIDMILDLLIVVVQITTATERPLKIANLIPETTITTIAVTSLCLQPFPFRHQFSPKLLMSATNVPSFKFK